MSSKEGRVLAFVRPGEPPAAPAPIGPAELRRIGENFARLRGRRVGGRRETAAGSEQTPTEEAFAEDAFAEEGLAGEIPGRVVRLA